MYLMKVNSQNILHQNSYIEKPHYQYPFKNLLTSYCKHSFKKEDIVELKGENNAIKHTFILSDDELSFMFSFWGHVNINFQKPQMI